MTSRQRDALVAEKVMGWRVDWDSYQDWYNCDVDSAPPLDDLIFTAPGDIFHGELRIFNVSNYSTDIEDAWLVAETIKDIEIARIGNGWRVVYDGAFASFAQNAPEAICLAALRVKGVNI